MSGWGAVKQVASLDWRAEWHEIAQLTYGEFAQSEYEQLAMRVLNLDALYQRLDRPGFVAAKAQLKEYLHAIGKGSQAIDPGLPEQPPQVLCAGEAQQSLLEGLAGHSGMPERPYPRL